MSSHQFTVQFIQFIVCCNLSCCYSNKHRHVIYITALQLCCFVEFCVLKSGDDFSSLHCLPSVRRRPDAVDGLNCTDLGKALSSLGLFDPVDCRVFVGFVACTIFDGRGSLYNSMLYTDLSLYPGMLKKQTLICPQLNRQLFLNQLSESKIPYM